MPFTYAYARPALTTDCVVFGLDEDDIKVLLIQRGLEPFRGQWALPGGFLRTGESPDDGARRELREETGLSEVFLEQLYTFGEPARDPREHVVTIAYYALVNLLEHPPTPATDADDAAWFPFDEVPPLAFDHEHILALARTRLTAKLRYTPAAFELLPEKFTLPELQSLYERVLGHTLDKRNFRKKLSKLGILIETDEFQQDAARRAARLHRFDHEAYQRLAKADADLTLL
ncbi:8-oxo-dGTP diphosphatase [Haloferula luteola]|uniref:8-oxo-dGTP diphosphatase n=1 Tax=Haloferula luteola TaxID=595692 RepID=A0A840V4B2_9BACT|nr:NUDIX domain-containing protein [Haloferula luteola]MBB5352383.1 8-oxo-dGTP diphosphatase [Haloferula luteola]